tara:strand:- start:350 stop:544 length:195 start_codon:yes stop_codon:yes gene_type:complete
MIHIYTERLGYKHDLDLLKEYMELDDIITILLDHCEDAGEVITEYMVEFVLDDVNVDAEVKVVE